MVRIEWRHACHPAPGLRRDSLLHLAALWLRLAVLLVLLAGAIATLPPPVALLLALVCGLVWASCEALDLVARKYLDLPLLQVARFAPVKAADADALQTVVKAIRTYVPLAVWMRLGAVGVAACALCAGPWHLTGPAALLALAGALVLAAVGLRGWAGRLGGSLALRPAERAFLAVDDSLPERRLGAADRSGACKAMSGRGSAARHVLLVVNESTGADVTCHGGLALAEAICAASGEAGGWLRPANPVTPSSCTDVALPCLFTGCAPQDSAETLHRMPLLFDLAKARGMTTLFYSASTLRWGNFEAFFGGDGGGAGGGGAGGGGAGGGAIDDLATPQNRGLPLVHELGCDDHPMAAGLRDRILTTDGPLFMVLYTYALHLPFLTESEGPIPDQITDRRSRAAHAVTEAHRMVFDALRQTGRYDDTLIVSVGDHGETFGVDGNDGGGAVSRLTKLSHHVTRPLFVIKPPASLGPAQRACLEANMDRLVSLIDVAPTVASVLGVELAEGLPPYQGYDLTCEVVPDDRLHVTLTVNEWRGWPQAAVMLAQGDLRVCVDYQTTESLCCGGDGKPVPAAWHGAADALLVRAMTLPVVSAMIARVFRDKLHIRARPQAKRFARVVPDVPRPLAIAGGGEWFFGTDILISDPGAGRLHYAGNRHDARGFGLGRQDRGIMVYGPYVDLPAGVYSASYVFAAGAGWRPVRMDVCAAGRPDIAAQEIGQSGDGRLATIGFALDRAAEGLEVRLHSDHGFSGICQGLFVTRIGD